MFTIKDIAQQAGVSKTTVSRVLNNSGYVGKDTRERIEAIIQNNNFSPSATARSLSKRETNTIGVMVPSADNRFFSAVLKGITKIVDKYNLTLIYCNTDESVAKEQKALLMLREQWVRGLILTPTVDYSEKAAARHFKKLVNDLNIPVVIMDRPIEYVDWDGVFFDGYKGSYQAVEALIKEGHRKIANITGDLNIRIARERFEGYKQALIDHGIEVEDKYIYKGNFTMEKAYQLSMQCLSMEDPPTAVHTSNNDTSLGFLKAVTEKGLKIPQDIAFIGFDALDTLDAIGVRYSFVDRDTEKMGITAMELLLERIAHADQPKREVIFPPILVLTGSEK